MRAKRETRKRSPAPGGDGSGGGDGAVPARRPPRVDSNLNISLRQQLRAAKAAAAAAAAAGEGGGSGGGGAAGRPRPVLRTKFRRSKTDEVVAEAWAAKQRRKAEERARMPDGKYLVGPSPIAYIDGYNVIGRWPQLQKRRDAGDLDGARRRLLRYVEEFATVREWLCVLVFDAHNTGTFLWEGRVGVVGIGDCASQGWLGNSRRDVPKVLHAASRPRMCRAGTYDAFVQRGALFFSESLSSRESWKSGLVYRRGVRYAATHFFLASCPDRVISSSHGCCDWY